MAEPRTLVDLLAVGEEQAGRTACVFRTGFRRFTFPFDESVRAASWVAEKLRALGVRAGETVLLWGPNSPAWSWAYFGVLAAGGVVVPADMRSGTDVVRTLAARARVSLVIQTRLKPALDAPGQRSTLFLEEVFAAWMEDRSREPTRVLHQPVPDDVAELLFTSGTTGDPKGVVLTHRNILSNIRALTEVIRVNPDWSFVSLLPLSHIFEQVIGFLVPWTAGAAVVYPRTIKPSEVFAALADERPTHFILVPRLLALFRDRILHEAEERRLGGLVRRLLGFAPRLPFPLRRLLFHPIRRRLGGRLRFLVSGGATLPPDLEGFWRALGIPIVQGYGLSETSPILACNFPDEQRVGSVGKPLPGQELAIGSGGEILARGPHVFRGYFEDPEKTARAFTSDGWFRTGDLGELSDGWLILKGRAKDLIVPAHGMNVYAEDVEQALLATPGVRDAAVLGVPGAGGEVVHAVLLLEVGAPPADEIVAAANARLDSAQQIGGHTVWAGEDFPRTPTLKPKKFLMKETLVKGGDAHRASAEPGSARGDRLRSLIAAATGKSAGDITGGKSLARDLGLDSLGRLELVSLIETELNTDVEEGDIGPETTVRDLERLVAESRRHRQPFLWDWPYAPFLIPLRALLQRLFALLLLPLAARVNVAGRERLSALRGPHIVVANHMSHLDTPVILAALPLRLRCRTAVFLRAETLEEARGITRALRVLGYVLLCFFLLPIPLPQGRGFRHALARAGRHADRGGSLLIFPEGTRGTGGAIQLFSTGVALAVQELHVPVVPAFLRGTRAILPPGRVIRLRVPRRSVRVAFGAPFRPSARSRPDITAEIQRAVEIAGTERPLMGLRGSAEGGGRPGAGESV